MYYDINSSKRIELAKSDTTIPDDLNIKSITLSSKLTNNSTTELKGSVKLNSSLTVFW